MVRRDKLGREVCLPFWILIKARHPFQVNSFPNDGRIGASRTCARDFETGGLLGEVEIGVLLGEVDILLRGASVLSWASVLCRANLPPAKPLGVRSQDGHSDDISGDEI